VVTATTRRTTRRRKPAKATQRSARPASRGERAQAGKAAREGAARSSHAEWAPTADRRDATAVLLEQAEDRVPELVPIRHGRMATTPFAFYRGGAAVMAGDLATTPSSGFEVQLCGDAHMSNFGGFASPERDLIFDLNDFDETLPGPWEWDVKRLLASVAIAGRERGFTAKTRRAMLRAAASQYRMAMRGFASASPLDVWYAHLDSRTLEAIAAQEAGARYAKRVARTTAKARTKDSMRAFAKLTERVDGQVRIAGDPPLILPVEDFLPDVAAHEVEDWMRDLLNQYRSSLPVDRRRLLDRFDYGHLARKVVGVGSVGTRAWIVLLLGRDGEEPLFLQAKEAQASVLEPYAGASEFDNSGQRVVEGQRLMQAAGDILLGWLRADAPDGVDRDFYVRQLWDWKASADVATMSPEVMAPYARACAWTLARAHARSGDAVAIGAYLGSGDTFDRAVAEFAESYADQNERDHRAFVEAIDAGRLAAESGL
jgi:uncharacterized protein (DUF2252 family)